MNRKQPKRLAAMPVKAFQIKKGAVGRREAIVLCHECYRRRRVLCEVGGLLIIQDAEPKCSDCGGTFRPRPKVKPLHGSRGLACFEVSS